MKTHRMKRMVAAACIVAVMVVSAVAQAIPRVPEAALKSAQQAFQLALGTTQRTQTFDAMGLRSEAESRQAVEDFDRLHALSPETPVLLSSGYSLNGQALDILKRGCRGFIQKPFNIEQLQQKIHEILSTA